MNAGIRSVVRTAFHRGVAVKGIYRGYQGMIQGQIEPLSTFDVANIIHRGGTFLKSARSEEFKTVEGRRKAYGQLQKEEIDALIAIGGNGTYTGADAFTREYDIPVIGLPGTISNDIYGTDVTIGSDTALYNAGEVMDKSRDRGGAPGRIFLFEG